MAFNDRFGNGVQEVAYPSLNVIALTNANPNVVLSWPIEFQNVNGVVAAILHITTDANGHSITLPPSNIVSPGQTIFFNNMNGGAFSVLIKNPDGTTLITLGGGGGNANTRTLYLLNNLTQSGGFYIGTWIDVPWGGGYSAVTSVGLAAAAGTASSNLTVTGSPITTTGTFQLGFTGDLNAILSLNTKGFVTRRGASSWTIRNLGATANQIAITNPDGDAGDPVISLEPNIRNITSLQAGNLLISGDTIAQQSANADIILTPNGTGELKSSNNLDILAGNKLKFFRTDNANYISFSSNSTMPANYDIIWPVSAPSPATFLMHLGSGQTSWQAINDAAKNLLVNGGLTVWQAGTNFTDSTYFKNNNGQFIVDYYRLWSDGDNIVNVSQQDGPTDANFSSPYCARLTLTPGGAGKKFGISQFFEYTDTQIMRGRTVSFSFVARSSGPAYNLRSALIYYNGVTADTLVTSLVQAASWGAQGTDPLLATNWNYINARTNLTLGSVYTRYSISNITLPSSNIKNIGIFIWMDNTNTNSADYVDIACIDLEYGPIVSPFSCGLFSDELAESKRIFQKDVAYETPVGTASNANAAAYHMGVPVSPAIDHQILTGVTFPIQMRATPSLITTYAFTNPALNNTWTKGDGVDLAVGSATVRSSDSSGFLVANETGGNITYPFSYLIGHWWSYSGI